MTTDHTQFDILIVGGGLTGKMMALTLSYSGYKIALMAPHPDKKDAFDRRSTTIHHAGHLMLDALAVADRLKDVITPITKIAVAVGKEKQQQSQWLLQWHSRLAADNTAIPMAYVIENKDLNEACQSALDELPDAQQITVFNDTVTGYQDTGQAAHITTQSGQMIHAKMVIACDGVKSQMRTLAGLSPRIEETGQFAISTTMRCELPHAQSAYQRFLETGPIALMPLADNHISLVWSTTQSHAEEMAKADNETFNAAVTQAFGQELGTLTVTEPLSVFPLRPHHNRYFTKGRLVLAGDAAHAIHPLAGMGYNLALADAAILLDLLTDAKIMGLAADHPSIMSQYQKKRMIEVRAISQVTSHLNRLLSRQQNMIGQLISIGMAIIDKTAIKQTFRDVAMGGTLSKARLFKGHLPSSHQSDKA